MPTIYRILIAVSNCRWVYGPPAPSSMSLIRDIAWDTAALQLVSFPVPELIKLRTKTILQPQLLGSVGPSNPVKTLPLHVPGLVALRTYCSPLPCMLTTRLLVSGWPSAHRRTSTLEWRQWS